MTPRFTFIDLFAGIGGFRHALQNVGGKCIGFSEIAPDAIKAYCDNFKESPYFNFGDITKLENLPAHDFMTAGVPCQSWSIAGKNLGFDDDRGQLWNDTLYLLNKTKPSVFIFENVKGLADPRNRKALNYILDRIKQAGYYADYYVLNAFDYGVPQTRVRIYIIGFKDKTYHDKFRLPKPSPGAVQLSDVLDSNIEVESGKQVVKTKSRWSLSCNNQGFNNYFLFNDLRNGGTTVHSWDLIQTTERQKRICLLILTNRRKKEYGDLDGNPLSLAQIQSIDPSVRESELYELVDLGILKEVSYLYKVNDVSCDLTDSQKKVLFCAQDGILNVDKLKVRREFKVEKIGVMETLSDLEKSGCIRCVEKRYDFKNTKISTGLNGINRIFLPTSDIYPTLVASDTNDYITDVSIEAKTSREYKRKFMTEVYSQKNYRKITKSEACKIQGFPANYILPESRPRWMKLIGNSVAVPVVQRLAEAILCTGVFGEYSVVEYECCNSLHAPVQLTLFDSVKHPTFY